MPSFFWRLEDHLPVFVPAHVELALILVRPLLGDVVRRVRCARAEIHEEGLVGRVLLGVGDEADGLVRDVLGKMIALLRRLGRFDRVIVVGQVRVVLVRVGAEKTVETLEPAAQRPAVVGSRPRKFGGRREVPLSQGIRVVTVLEQDLRQKAVLERDVTVAAGKAGGAFGDAGHGVGMVVAAGQDARARGRTEGRGVHVVEEQPVLRQVVDVRRFNRTAVAAHLAETRVVLHNEKDVGHPSLARKGCGQAGCDTSNVRPMTPVNAVPGLYSLSAIGSLLSHCNIIFDCTKIRDRYFNGPSGRRILRRPPGPPPCHSCRNPMRGI